ncbi:hypothetical protein [Alkalihalobacillus sp. LMS39]|uniref:hypothetical protein n=1 Tax=Alkalihalobacillus sp. LMS39 TaxID=2924032 RepID=UPI001FB48F31|nr:hypothetical protein [Alkalihalobacillus sp. LMS39]UOE95554.1 hypothetical protein MM271_08085 [Alkalihalobacillus sp. LMS39]
MRASMNQQLKSNGNQLFTVDFHDFIEREQQQSHIELASEFGMSVRDIKYLKKKIERN